MPAATLPVVMTSPRRVHTTPPRPEADDGAPSFAAHVARHGLLTDAALERAERMTVASGDRLPAVITKLGLMTERDMAKALADFCGLAVVEPSDYPEAPVLADRLSPRFLSETKVIPIADRADGVTVALADPTDRFAVEALRLAVGRPLDLAVAVPADLDQALERLYRSPAGPDGAGADGPGDDIADIERLKDLASEAPVIQAVNRLIARAVELSASDIHVEPAEAGLAVRLRLDGVLRAEDPLPADLKPAIVSRIKIMAGLDIAERRVPQDGRIKLTTRGSVIDLRVSVIPTVHGESIVLRVLDQGRVALEFGALGIDGDAAAQLTAALDRPNGIFLVTGPTGSGKTTTLYAALKRMITGDRKIITVEDPVEYQLDGITQIPVRPAVGLGFPESLRAILRHDPDVILVGEIRDKTTATIAAQAALTGHLVLSTLHTNSAAGSVTRLLDMGVDAYLVTATVNGVMAQRLVRRLCPDCKQPYTPDAEAREHLGLPEGVVLYRAQGCPACLGRGYRGRTTIMETLVMTEELRRMILRGGDAHDLQAAAVASGMVSLYRDGLAKAVAGITSVEEVLRVARDG